MKFFNGSTYKVKPDEAAKHGDKLKLVDMKGSLYRATEDFEIKPERKVKRESRKGTDKG